MAKNTDREFQVRGGLPGGTVPRVFLFFSSRLGCLGSLVLSALLTLLVLFLLHVL